MEQAHRPETVVITGGGTGGHLYPALAVAETIQQERPEAQILFIGLDREKDRQEAEKRGLSFYGLRLAGLKRKLTWSNVRAFWLFLRGVYQCMRILRACSKGVIFGVGGYASAPAMTAGKMLGWKLALHEQNTVPGIVNRMLATRCDAVFTTYAITQTYMPKVSCQQTGFPLRRELLQAQKEKRDSKNDNPHILVIGGSQGAKKVVESCLAVFHQLSGEGMVFQATVQTGERNYAWAREQNPPSPVRLVPFITDMATAYSNADMIISRAGSGSLSEIALWQIPAILIPFPFSSENHQKVNAEFFAHERAAFMIEEKELTVERLKQDVSILLSQRDTRVEMSRRMASLRRTDAAAAIASEMIRLVQQH